jgi:hypothetical protein
MNASRDGLLTVNNGLLIIRGPPAVNNHVNNTRNNYTLRPSPPTTSPEIFPGTLVAEPLSAADCRP